MAARRTTAAAVTKRMEGMGLDLGAWGRVREEMLTGREEGKLLTVGGGGGGGGGGGEGTEGKKGCWVGVGAEKEVVGDGGLVGGGEEAPGKKPDCWRVRREWVAVVGGDRRRRRKKREER